MYSLVYTTFYTERKIPSVQFVKKFRTFRAAVDACFAFANTWSNWKDNAEIVVYNEKELCLATAFEVNDIYNKRGIVYAALTVKEMLDEI